MRIRLKHRELAGRLARSKLSQNAWAHRLGLAPGHLSRLVNGKRLYPGPQTRQKLIQGLGMPFEALFEIDTRGERKTENGKRKNSDQRRLFGRLEAQIVRRLNPLFRPPFSVLRFPHGCGGFAAAGRTREKTNMSRMLQDLRDAWKALRRSPGFAFLSIFTLALAIGVNTAIFSMVSVVLFTDLPIRDGETLGFLFSDNPQRGVVQSPLTPREFLEYQQGLNAFEQLAAVDESHRFILTGVPEPEMVDSFAVSWNLFQVWGTGPLMGRGFRPDEDRSGAPLVTVISYSAWRDRFGSDEGILGRTIQLDGESATVIGVMDPAMEVGDIARGQFWVPLRLDPSDASQQRRLVVTGKLRQGATLEQAEEQMKAVHAELRQRFPDSYAGWQPALLDYDRFIIGEGFWAIIVMLSVTVGCVLLTACSNVATLMLARASARSRELALRAALGAGRLQILRQLLSESLIIALAAGTAGLLLTRLCLSWMVWMVSQSSGMGTFVRMLSIDANALFFTLLVSLAAPLLFGLLPALRASRLDLSQSLKETGQRMAGGHSLKGRRFLVTAQVSLALALMTVSGLLLRSVIESRTLERGFETQGILTCRLELPQAKYQTDQSVLSFFDDVLAGVRSLPEFESAAWVSNRLMAEGNPRMPIQIQGRPQEEPERAPWAGLVVMEPAYLGIQGIPLLSGRSLSDSDKEGTLPVALINRQMAQQHWPSQSPLGQLLRVGDEEIGNSWLTVVGVVADTSLHAGREESANPVIYVPFSQNPRRSMALVSRPRGDLASAVGALRRTVAEVDSDQPLQDVRTLEQIYADAVAPSNMLISLFTAFAAFALAMSSAGIYGVTAYSVARRTREFGIRMALGAVGKNVLSLVFRQALWLVGIGIMLGSLGGWALVQIMASGIEGVSEINLGTLLWPAAALGAVAFAACYLPARRATRIDPVIALRAE